MMPFLGRGPGAPGWPHDFVGRSNLATATAVQPDAALIQALANARPADTEGYLDQELEKGGTWYIDLPHRTVLLGDSQVRAVFMMPVLEKGHRVTAVVTDLGGDKIKGRVLWPLGEPARNYGYTIAEIDMNTAADQINDLIRLLVLYRATAARAQRSSVARMDAEQLDRSPRRISQNRKKTSLFSVEKLAAPADRFGRRLAEGRKSGAWSLGWRSEVSGHFRLQAHGAGRTLRKLIWVEAYQRGPENAPRKVRLERLS